MGIASAALAAPPSGAPDARAAAAGERIYLDGVLPSGQALHARRADGSESTGAVVACVNCHRRSGLGTVEGVSLVPPITVKYLRRSVAENVNDLDMAHVEGFEQHHVPYSDAALATALSTGRASDGRTLGVLMPRYDLDDAAMSALVAYLDTLGAKPSPGVSEKQLQFATVITPDADPVERQAMLAVMQRFFDNQSAVIAAETRPMRASHEIRYRVTRQWRLHVWELSGSADTWGRQLHERMAVEPVFAIVSGLGKGTWQPIHRFCESEHVPCLFPNIDAPVVDEADFYSAYFSRGVLLEADLVSYWLAQQPAAAGRARLVQIYRKDDAGAAGAAALRSNGANAAWDFIDRPLAASAGSKDLRRALAAIKPSDTLMLWLRAADLEALPATIPTQHILLSGLMGGLESAALPESWRKHAHMSYPVDLPERRLARMNFPFGWFRAQHIPLTAEQVEINTYLACVITAEAVGHLFDSFVPEYLLERMEMMVSRRLANAYFPRLSLAPGERFASKGGFMVHFDEESTAAALPATAEGRTAHGIRVIADSDWLTP